MTEQHGLYFNININHTNMKNLLSFVFLLIGLLSFAQPASRVNPPQNVISSGQPRVVMSADTLPNGTFRLYSKPSVLWNWGQIINTPTTPAGYGLVLTKNDVGLSNVNNTSDADKPVSNAQAAVNATKADNTTVSNNFTTLNNGKADKTTTLTLNGTTQDLSSNRTWIVGDVRTTSTYPNPSWIPSYDYTKLTNTPVIPAAQVNSDWNANSGVSQILNKPTIPAQVNLTSGNRISITGTYPNLTISYIEPTINQVTRNVNTNYTIGARQATVFYAVPVTATNPLLIGTSVGTAFLEYSTNAGANWTTALPTSTQSSVGLSVTIQLTTGGSNILSGVVPANALVRIRTTVSGTATVGNATGQEVY